MAVYVDTARNKFRRMIMCHMIADTESELHGMAFTLGLRAEWFQHTSMPHYDLSLSVRKIAVEKGAVVLERKEFVAKMKEIRGIRC